MPLLTQFSAPKPVVEDNAAPPAEPPAQVYYPRWRAALTVRFGEFGRIGQLAKLVPKKPARSAAGVKPQRGDLVAKPDPDFPGQYVITQQGATPAQAGGPQAQGTSDDGLTHRIEGVVPQSFRWSQNGIRTGDTLTLVLRTIDLPVDPRTVRSVAVEFFLGTVTAGDHMDQVLGRSQADQTAGGDGRPADLLPDTYTDSHGNPRSNLRFQGWVDKWKCTWSDGQPVIELTCTDNTRALINLAAPQKTLISTQDPIDKAIADYLATFPALAGLSVQYRPSGLTPPTIGKVVTKSTIRGGKGVGPAKNAGTEKMTVWDHITDTCRALGHAVYVEGTTVVITRTRTLTSSNVQPRQDDPYVPRTLPTGERLTNRRMVFGRNVSHAEVERDFAYHPPQNISVRAYDNEQKKVIVERFPQEADKQVFVIPGNNTPDEKWLEFTIGGGVKDSATLRIFAQEMYENIARQEIGVSIQTMNLGSFGGGNEDPDLLDMKFGDALELLFNREDFYSTLNKQQLELDSQALNSQLLQAAGFPAGFADAYAKAYTDAGFTSIFRVHKMEVSGDTEDGGVVVDVKAVNYVEVTSDAALPAGEEPPQTAPPRPPAAPNAPPPGAPQTWGGQ